MKSGRDGTIQLVMQTIVFWLGTRYGLPDEVQVALVGLGFYVYPAIYRGLRRMDNGVGKFIRDMDPAVTTPVGPD